LRLLSPSPIVFFFLFINWEMSSSKVYTWEDLAAAKDKATLIAIHGKVLLPSAPPLLSPPEINLVT